MTRKRDMPPRYGFRLCPKPTDLGTVMTRTRNPGAPLGTYDETLHCATGHGVRIYRKIKKGRRVTWMVFSRFDDPPIEVDAAEDSTQGR